MKRGFGFRSVLFKAWLQPGVAHPQLVAFILSEMVCRLWPQLTPTFCFSCLSKCFIILLKLELETLPHQICVASPAHRHPLTPFPPAPLLQYFALLLCIFLLEVLAGVLAYIYYQQVKPLQSTDCFKSPLTYICARCEKSQIKSLFQIFVFHSGSSRVASRGSG